MDGPQPVEGRAASKPTKAQATPAVQLMGKPAPKAAGSTEG